MENYERDMLGAEEFANEILDLISKKIVSEEYMEANEEFVDAMLLDLYQSYLDGCSIKLLSNIMENMFYNMFMYKPKLKNM